MGICYIVGAGDFHGSFIPNKEDLVIAADGGFDTLHALGITPDLLIGDLDSIKTAPRGIELIRHPIEKDETDMHLAYLEGKRRGYTVFKLYGGVGGRLDHTLANLSLLLYAKNRGDLMTLKLADGEAFVIKDEAISLKGVSGSGISVFAMEKNAARVTISGLKYECRNEMLTEEFALGVSNSFTDSVGEISVEDGSLLITVSGDYEIV